MTTHSSTTALRPRRPLPEKHRATKPSPKESADLTRWFEWLGDKEQAKRDP
jgi:hypothetical protein